MSSRQPSLSTLPCELRLQIYSYTLSSTTALTIKPAVVATKTNQWWDRPFRDYTAPGIMLTNRQMRSEALELYHKFLLSHVVDLQGMTDPTTGGKDVKIANETGTIDAIDNPRKCVWIVGNSPGFSAKEMTLMRCERDATEKEIRLVEMELEWQKATVVAE